jgi:hypothetical protein
MADQTHRVRLSRKAGARLPADAVSVAYPTKWANPHRPATRSLEANATAVAAYREQLMITPDADSRAAMGTNQMDPATRIPAARSVSPKANRLATRVSMDPADQGRPAVRSSE